MSNQIPDFFPKLPVLLEMQYDWNAHQGVIWIPKAVIANRMKGEAIFLLRKVKYYTVHTVFLIAAY
jgi:hypothetical protein